MKYNLLVMLAFFLLQSATAQVETGNHKEVSQQFEKHYNADEYGLIFSLYSEEMKTYLPLEKTTTFLSGLKTQLGKITAMEFGGFVQGSYASYKTTFEAPSPFALNISLDDEGKINGIFIKPWVEKKASTLERNSTKLILPFKGEWYVFWGGKTKEQNYHVEYEAQKGAFDIVIRDEKGSSFKNTGAQNEDYYAFGKELIAPCDAEVVLVVDGVKDNKPGELNPVYVPGNTVILKTAKEEYLFFAHFKQHSIVAKQGQQVKQGELLGLCGNSGNSSEPHLHFHIQDVEDMNKATGARCFFEKIVVDGEVKEDYSPVKGERIKNK